ncbi:amino acid adenylation domain-containing protein [Streptomyces caniscabiei]|uniref:non-ribosomal peptide synthetase n=1 Tax=Streptomyces caniscabiei TaxID=2746961 RepID=UPI0029A3D889|nr:non-ribosomal peptide synthetase [Streptomyces caniscabiei]MDX2776744.1 amino acid adenylation domain-containing protein [Streptomyces caniscabiei]
MRADIRGGEFAVGTRRAGEGAGPQTETPLSVGQASLLFLHGLAPDSPAYHITACVTVGERLETDRLRRAWGTVCTRHSVLTAVVAPRAEGYVQRWDGAEAPFVVRETPGIGAEELRLLATRDYERPFALDHEAPARFFVYQDTGTTTLHLVLHHIAGDMSSLSLVIEDLLTAYRSETEGTPGLPAASDNSYARHVAAERAFLDGPRSGKSRRYWEKQLAGCRFALDLPGMTPPRPVADPMAPAHVRFRIGPDLTVRIRELAASRRGTPATVLLSAFNVLLHKLTACDDIVVGFPVEGRKTSFKRTVGHFTNSLLLRASVTAGTTFDSVLDATRTAHVDAVRHRALPTPTVLGRLTPGSALSGQSLYQVSFQFESDRLADGTKAILGDLGTVRFAGFDTVPVPVRQQVGQFPLRLQAGEIDGEVHGVLHFDPARLDAETVAGYARLFETVVAEAVTDPTVTVAHIGAGADTILRWSGAGMDAVGDGLPVHRAVVAHALTAPDDVALIDGERAWTYAELERASAMVAARLRRLGIGPESVVGLCLPRGAATAIGMLGVLRAGGAWLALDPSYPSGRLRLMASEARCAAVVRSAAQRQLTVGVVSEDTPVLELDGLDLTAEADRTGLDAAHEDDLAYLVFTSGSTGRPKGVAVSHRTLARSTAARGAFYGPLPPRFLLLSSFSFDSAYAGVFWTLTFGGTLVIPDADQVKDPEELAELVERHALTHTLTVPSFYRALLNRPDGPGRSLRTVVVAGESCPPDLVAEHRSVLPQCALVNEYGPSEATVWATGHICVEAPGAPVPIGTPIAGTTVYVLDRALRPVVAGGVGELFVGGAGVARGYAGRGSLTAEKFVPDPFSNLPGARLYRTGDLVRFDTNGVLEFHGRVDEQIKIRGFRVELGEIEAVIRTAAGVADTAVAAVAPPGEGERRLVAYVVPRTGVVCEPEAIRAWAAERLPAHMVPTAILILDALPLSVNGKVDRRALPTPTWESATHDHVPPRNEVERRLAEIWHQVLGLEHISVHDDFLTLGGDSILSIQVVARARRAGIRLTPRQLFETPTIAQLASQAEMLPPRGDGGPGADNSTPDTVDMAGVPADRLASWERAHGPLNAVWPMSALQQGMLYHALADPRSDAYTEQLVCTLSGDLDPHVFLDAWRGAITRHSALRARCAWQDVVRPVLVVAQDIDVPVIYEDWRTAGNEEPTPERLQKFLARDRSAGFELGGGPLVRLALLRMADNRWTFVWTNHHILLDGWSLPVVAGDAFALYAALRSGGDLDLAPAPDYGAFVRWSESRDRAEDEAYWSKQLAGFTAPALLAPARAAAEASDSALFEPALRLTRERSHALHEAARERGVTLAALVHAAWALVVAQRTGAQDLTVGSVLSGRPPEIDGIENTVGLFINTLPLRVRISDGMRADDLLGSVLQGLHDLTDHQHASLTEVTSWAKAPAGARLFDSIVVIENYPFESFATDGFTLESSRVLERTTYPVSVQVVPGEHLELRLCVDAAAFDEGTAQRLLDDLGRALNALTGDPDITLGELGLSDTGTVLAWSGARETTATVQPVAEAVVARALSAPDDGALVDGGQTWTYKELERASAVVAEHLRQLGAGPDSVVGLCLPRGAAMATAMLGVLRAGAAWLVLDPTYPTERLRLMTAEAQCLAVVSGTTQRKLIGGLLPAGTSLVDFDGLDLTADADRTGLDAAHEDDLAYLVFTSGSTGRPKGVAVTHGQLAVHLAQISKTFGLTTRERVLVFGSFAFDVSTEQLFAPLTRGGSAVIRPDGLLGTEELLGLLAEHQVTVFNPPTGLWRQLATDLADGAAVPTGLAVRLTVVGGDAMPTAEVDSWRRTVGGRVLNAYGPTETVITATVHEATGNVLGTVPLGRPLPGRTVYVLDGALRPVVAGGVGELFVGGAGVARGYAGRGSLTAEKFVPDPFSNLPGARLYRTGDLVRFDTNGVLEFHGRADEQIKIRGFRVELGEIEAVIRTAAGVADTAVAAVAPPGEGERRLVAYVVPRTGTVCEPEAIRAWAAERLPAHMVPTAILILDALPLSANGKVDRRALPAPTWESATHDHVPPRNDIEHRLAEIWSDVLGLNRISVHDDFLTLGGDSILSIQVVARARRAGIRLTPRQLFQHPTIAQLAPHVTIGTTAGTRPPGDSTDELSPIQQWFHELDLTAPAHWNMGLLLGLRIRVGMDELAAALNAVVDAHEALRTRFTDNDSGRVHAVVDEMADVPVEHTDLSDIPTDLVDHRLRELADDLNTRIDPVHGPLLRAHLADLGPRSPQRLLLAAHHLVMDAVSWRIVLEDLEYALAAVREGSTPVLQPEGTTHRQWTAELRRRALDPQAHDRVRADLEELAALAGPGLTTTPPGTEGTAHRARRELTVEQTERLRHALVHSLGGSFEEGLLTAAARAHARIAGLNTVVVELESHGREDLHPDLDLSRTVGWFTTLAPLPVATADDSPLSTLWDVRARLRDLVHRGIDHGVVRHLTHDAELAGLFESLPAPHLNFNYLGRVGTSTDTGPGPSLELLVPGFGRVRDQRGTRPAAIVVESLVTDGSLAVEVEHVGQAEADALVDAVIDELNALTDAPNPLVLAGGMRHGTAPVTAVRDWAARWGDLTAVWPLTPTQEGMVFRTLAESGASAGGVYVEQLVGVLEGDLDQRAFADAWQAAFDRHPVLRGVCVWQGVPRPLLVVPASRELPVTFIDLTSDPDAGLDAFVAKDRHAGFDLGEGPLARLAVARLAADRWAFVWSNHHVLFDGWSLPLLLGDVLEHYAASRRGDTPQLASPPDFGAFTRWVARQDPEVAKEFWTQMLKDFSPAALAPERERPAIHRDHVVRLTASDTARLRETAGRLGVTLGGMVHAAWALTVATETEVDDVVFGSVGSGRPAELEDVDRMVGMFINTVPLRTRLPSARPIGAWARDVQQTLNQVHDHIHTPLARIAVWSGQTSSSALFDTSVIVANFPFADLGAELPGLSVIRTETHEQTELPVTVSVGPEGDRLVIALNHDTVRVSADRAAALADRFCSALTALADDTATVAEVCAGLREQARSERAVGRARRAARLGLSTRPRG